MPFIKARMRTFVLTFLALLFTAVSHAGQLRISPEDQRALDMGSRAEFIVILDVPALQNELATGAQKRLAVRRAFQTVLSRNLPDRVNPDRARNGRETELLVHLGMVIAKLSAAEVRRLVGDPLVLSVESSHGHIVELESSRAAAVPSLPVDPLKAIRDHYGVTDLQTMFGLNGRGQVVAVIDSGVDYDHEFFKQTNGASRVIKGACFATRRPVGFVSTCRNDKGVRVNQNTTGRAGRPCDLVADSRDCGHGTHVAGIAAGRLVTADSTKPASGIAPFARIVPINVFSVNTRSRQVHWDNIDLIRALEYIEILRSDPVAPLNIAVVNMSFAGDATELSKKGCRPGDQLDIPFNSLKANGVYLVAAAGNDGDRTRRNVPACYGAVKDIGNARFDTEQPEHAAVLHVTSNNGTITFPGTDIRSSLPGNTYGRLTGTSQAAPIMAGAFLLMNQAKQQGKLDIALFDEARRMSTFEVTRDDPPGCRPGFWECAGANPSPHIATTILGSYRMQGSIRYLYTPYRNVGCCYRTVGQWLVPPVPFAKCWSVIELNQFLFSIGAPTRYALFPPQQVKIVPSLDNTGIADAGGEFFTAKMKPNNLPFFEPFGAAWVFKNLDAPQRSVSAGFIYWQEPDFALGGPCS